MKIRFVEHNLRHSKYLTWSDPEEAKRTPFNRSKKDGNYWAWEVSMKAKENTSAFHWYAFVNLNNWPRSDESPDVFFVPAKIVAEVVTEWNNKPSTRLFFIIKEDERERYIGLAGSKKIEIALT